MKRLKNRNKYVFIGDYDSINIEIICKSHSILKKKINYIIIGNLNDLKKYLRRIKSTLELKLLIDPYNFNECDDDCLNFFNIDNISRTKYENLLNQIKVSNFLSNKTGFDLITMPIDKSIFKKKINFIGMTEHLAEINQKKTMMLLHGDKFSVIPLTTHINLARVNKIISEKKLLNYLKTLMIFIKDKKYNLNFNSIKFLCYNPHCSENRTLGNEDHIIDLILKKFKLINGPYPADSSFNNIKTKTLFVSTYHDQVLIPFKSLNTKMVNITLGLNYRRLSPAHGTAKDIKFKNLSNIDSYIECMKI